MATVQQKTKCLKETLEHILEVSENINKLIHLLLERASSHDASKLEEPELSGFAVAQDLSKIEYNSDEYKESLKALEDTIAHHHAKNRHHPQHWPEGVDGMCLIDLCEMFSDWLASSNRNKSGNLLLTLKNNAEKFKISDQLLKILTNTLERHFQK